MASEYSSQTTRSRSDDESFLSPVDEAEMTVLSSPAGLVYEIDQLPASKGTVVRETFTEPPTLALQQCRQIGDTYAFQMSELVTRKSCAVSYAVKLRTLLARLRKSTVGAGLKRPSSSQASDAKRIK